MSDIVEELRASRRVQQFDSAGRLITLDGSPTSLELEAAAEIERLRAAVNSHDDLIKALEAFLEWDEAEEHQSPIWATGERKRPDFWERGELFDVARDLARSALEKAGGKP